jgi:hypothetical protein
MHQFDYNDYIYTEPENWDKVFTDFKQKDISYSAVAKLIGIPFTSLQRLRGGTEPKHSVGVSILKLHSRLCSTF